jgi:OOP family OmpA-OmpF porin
VADDLGWYLGGNIGQSRAKIDDARITNNVVGGGFTSIAITDNNRDTGYKLFGGYKFNKNFALEAGYFNLGKFGFTSTTVPAGTLNGNISLDGMNLDAVGILPITDTFSAFARVGMNSAKARDTFTSSGAVPAPTNLSPSKREFNPKVGIGVQYDFTKSLGMRVEAERYRINDAIGNRGDINLFSIGLVYRFGEKTPTPAPVQKVTAPEPVAPEPLIVVMVTPPPPAVVPPPPKTEIPPPPRKVPVKVVFASDSTADSLFDFNKSEVKPSGKQAIDKFTSDLGGASYDVITVTGHTDRIGSRAYNMKLSERRAEAVKAYMVDSTKISPATIITKGVGESEPVTKPGECKGKKSKKLIACLASDRRVEVVVTATRVAR